MDTDYNKPQSTNTVGSSGNIQRVITIGIIGVLASLPLFLTKLESKAYRNSLDGQSKFNTKYGSEIKNEIKLKTTLSADYSDMAAQCIEVRSNENKYSNCMDEAYDKDKKNVEITSYVASSGGHLIDTLSKEDQARLSDLEKKFLLVEGTQNEKGNLPFPENEQQLIKDRDEILVRCGLKGNWRVGRVDGQPGVRFEYSKK